MLFDYRAKHQRFIQKVRNSDKITPKNKELFEKFRRYLIAQEHSDAHIDKMFSHLKLFLITSFSIPTYSIVFL